MVKTSTSHSIILLCLAVLFGFAGFTACTTKHEAGPVALGTLSVNGPGIDGTVFSKTGQYYTLSSINAGQQYTLRTIISTISTTASDGSTTYVPDGTLTISIYNSESSYKNNEPAELVVDSGIMSSTTTSFSSVIYEKSFTAAMSGDYIAVMNGESTSVPGEQFFYDFRLMSADANYGALTSFSSIAAPYTAVGTQTLETGYLNIYNYYNYLAQNPTFTMPSGANYLVQLSSDASSTSEYPQMFFYTDSSLTTTALMLSSIPTSSYFLIYRYSAGTPTLAATAGYNVIDTSMMTGITGSNPPVPIIVIKGVASSATYTLTIGPP